jgi:hypothetical protein
MENRTIHGKKKNYRKDSSLKSEGESTYSPVFELESSLKIIPAMRPGYTPKKAK